MIEIYGKYVYETWSLVRQTKVEKMEHRLYWLDCERLIEGIDWRNMKEFFKGII